MFDVLCHLNSDLSGPWCDSSPCRNECTDAASVAYICFYEFFEDPEQKGTFLYSYRFLDLMLVFLVNEDKILVFRFISVVKL